LPQKPDEEARREQLFLDDVIHKAHLDREIQTRLEGVQSALPGVSVARVGPLRRRRRQGANGSVDDVRAMGAPRGWRPLVLDPSGAVADFRALVFRRRSLCDMSGTNGRSYFA
jgi:hypothetical protein